MIKAAEIHGRETLVETGLTTTEARQLTELEGVIETGLKTFTEVGNALLAIRDGKLYRAGHETFAAYCRDRWNLKERRAYQLMDSSAVVNQIKSCTNVRAINLNKQVILFNISLKLLNNS